MKSIKPMISGTVLLAIVFADGVALVAQSNEYLDTQNASNRGQLRMAAAYHFELVVATDIGSAVTRT
jgi:hypothetical protein